LYKIDIVSKKDGPVIDQRLHGQFIEFLGTCISDGIWVGEDSSIPNIHGIRKDVVDALARIAPPVVRWPGGCYADTYHWRNGIGGKAERPVTYNNNFGTQSLEYNHFGTHEFVEFCRLIGAEPWININMLSGTVAEMQDWAEYCNRESGTTLAKLREENGSGEPFNVRYWGIGNESWAGGGNYTAKGYAGEYRKYASAFPRFGRGLPLPDSDEGMKLIAVGPDGNKPKERVQWTKGFFKALSKYRQPPIYGYDLHFYNWNVSHPADTVVEFSKEDWDRVIEGAQELEEVILEQYALVQEGLSLMPQPESSFMPVPACELIVGEWGNWHRFDPAAPSALWQQATMRDAVTTAITLDIFHRHSDKVAMACAAQTVNVLNSLILTQGENTILTPNFHVFEMYKPHRNATALACAVTEGNEGTVFAFASKKEGILYLNMVNTSYDEAVTVDMHFDCNLSYISGRRLEGEPADCNTVEHPEAVKPEDAPVPEGREENWSAILPKASVTVYQFQMI